MLTLTVTPEQLTRLQVLSQEPRVPDAGTHVHNYIAPLIYFLSLVKPKSILEIGSFSGVSTEAFCLMCDSVTVVDPFLYPEAEERFNERLKPYVDKLTVIKGYSPVALKDIPDGSFDMCYVDGDHNLEAVMADITECRRLVRPGGILAGHDWNVVPQVNAAVILSLRGMNPLITIDDSTWVSCNS